MKTAKEFRAEAREALQGRYWRAFLVTLIATALGAFGGSSGGAGAQNSSEAVSDSAQMQLDPEMAKGLVVILGIIIAIAIVIGILMIVIGGAVELGYNAFNIELYRTNEKPSVSMLFCRFNIFGKAFALRILMFLKIFAWSLLFIIPGIIAAYRYAMAPYLLAENPELTAKEAIEQSKALMAGEKWRLFCLQLSFIGWYLLGALALGVGILFVTPYQRLAETAFYLELTAPSPVEAPAEAAPMQV